MFIYYCFTLLFYLESLFLFQISEEVARKKADYQKHLDFYRLMRTRFEEYYIKCKYSKMALIIYIIIAISIIYLSYKI